MRVYWAIFLVGMSGILLEVSIIREFLSMFLGNELTLGVAVSGWLTWEALGALLGERKVSSNEKTLFVLLSILYALISPVSTYLIRLSRPIMGIGHGETFSMAHIVLISFMFSLAPALLHGVLFSLCCRITESGGKTYIVESLGTVLGGFVATYLILGKLPLYFAVLLSSIFSMAASSIVLQSRRIATAFLSALLIIPISLLDRWTANSKWKPEKIIFRKDSPYGRIVVTEKGSQRTIFTNGLYVASVPEPDIQSLEFLTYPALLLSEKPGNVLIIGGAAGYMAKLISRVHGVRKIILVEIDREVLRASACAWGKNIWKKLKKVKVVVDDGRRFLKNCKPGSFDVIISSIGEPSNLETTRLLTDKFFQLSRRALKEGGVLCFSLPSSFPYLTRDVARVNLSVVKSLKSVFKHTLFIPGESENIFLASEHPIRMNVAKFFKRLRFLGINPLFLSPPSLTYRLGLRGWFLSSMGRVRALPNTDDRPSILYYYLLLWTSEYSPALRGVLEDAGRVVSEKPWIVVTLPIMLLLTAAFFIKSKSALFSSYVFILSTGLLGMILSLSLLFVFQIACGSLYSQVGFLVGLFMTGGALGAATSENLGKVMSQKKVFLAMDLSIAIFGLALSLLIPTMKAHPALIYLTSAASGFVVGFEFPAATRFSSRDGREFPGHLFSADLIGGCVGGIVGSCLFIPIMGITPTIQLFSVLKITVWIPTALLVLKGQEGSF